jgi:hypothetical protein
MSELQAGPYRPGWWFPQYTKKLHYFDAWGLSLCEKYNVPNQVATMPDTGATTAQCRICRRKLDGAPKATQQEKE